MNLFAIRKCDCINKTEVSKPPRGFKKNISLNNNN